MKLICGILMSILLTCNAYSQDKTHSLYAGSAVEFSVLFYDLGNPEIPLSQTTVGYRQKIDERWTLDVGLAGMHSYSYQPRAGSFGEDITIHYKGGGLYAGLNYTLLKILNVDIYGGFYAGSSYLLYDGRFVNNGWFSEDDTWSGKRWNFSAGPTLGFVVNITPSGFIKIEASPGAAREDYSDHFAAGVNPNIYNQYSGNHYYFYFRPQAALGFRF
jgi:hypothetical protein